MARCSEGMVFDKENKQEYFEFIGNSIINNEDVVGFVWIDRPWYSAENCWDYYIRVQKYTGGGFCGGAIDLGFEDIMVDRNTIRPCTQIEKIKRNQRHGLDTYLLKDILDDSKNAIAFIGIEDEIPYKLWEK